eukprot:403354187
MGGFDKIFGMGLIFAGVLIAIYYSVWVLASLPFVHKQLETNKIDTSLLFLPPVWLFRLPALALIGGISFIWFFISHTNKKIARAKAEAAAKLEAEKKKQ